MSQSQGKSSESWNIPFLHNILSGRILTCTVQFKSGSQSRLDMEGDFESSSPTLQEAILNALWPGAL